MGTQSRALMPAFSALAFLALAVAHLGYEHFNGGVQSHHLLHRADLPVISNWLGLAILPLLGWILGVRIRSRLASSSARASSKGIWIVLVGGFLYGAAMAGSFGLEALTITSGLFFGLLVLAAVLPLHRAEWISGFVVGMTFTFGAVLPFLVACVVATVSLVIRLIFRGMVSAFRSSRRSPGAA